MSCSYHNLRLSSETTIIYIYIYISSTILAKLHSTTLSNKNLSTQQGEKIPFSLINSAGKKEYNCNQEFVKNNANGYTLKWNCFILCHFHFLRGKKNKRKKSRTVNIIRLDTWGKVQIHTSFSTSLNSTEGLSLCPQFYCKWKLSIQVRRVIISQAHTGLMNIYHPQIKSGKIVQDLAHTFIFKLNQFIKKF